MKAIVHEGAAGLDGVSCRDMPEAVPKQGEIRVRLKAAGLNHRDLFVLHRHKEAEPPLIIGSDGAGIVDAVGEGVTSVTKGDKVIINPGIGWPENSEAPPAGFEIVGLPFHGTFAESIVISAENAVPKPAHLSWEEAGVLSLAALTAYRALFTKGNIKAGMTVLIPGIGGGVATFLLQFAKAAGAAVYVTSRSEQKRREALKLGADKALDSAADWAEALGGEKVDLVIESVGAATFNQSLEQLKKGGTIVTFGSSTGDEVTINLRNFFYGQFHMHGSTLGSGEELKDALQFIEKHELRPVVDQTYKLNQFKEAFTRIENAEQIGKIAFAIE
ncbi:zinc-binding dehydrogenase [Domibacillus indicus]|uniref:zinc-binding dehydrogenase n=1 Tax=Domibacillus indicus TaxID=1437523 RepID=UPI000617EB03|nr:zinc-binding dehydrogenase [Domibacillus indicus]